MPRIKLECEAEEFSSNFAVAAAVAGIAFLCDELPDHFGDVSLVALKSCAGATCGSIRNQMFATLNIQPAEERDTTLEPVNHIGH